MPDDLTALSYDPAESGQDNNSALFKYLSLLGSAANQYREQLQGQSLLPGVSSPESFVGQVRGSPTKEPEKYSSDAMQRLSGLFMNDSPSSNSLNRYDALGATGSSPFTARDSSAFLSNKPGGADVNTSFSDAGRTAGTLPKVGERLVSSGSGGATTSSRSQPPRQPQF